MTRLSGIAHCTCRPTETNTFAGHYTFNRRGGMLRFRGIKFFEDRQHFERCLEAWSKSNEWEYAATRMPVVSIGSDEIAYALLSEAA